ncbi:hypothetical protein [Vagococcus fluvialis]|uniref:hypothetical protein n=1 Tax=Vagococcus fluvialis TaxID=2738 RepID=UPI003B210D85
MLTLSLQKSLELTQGQKQSEILSSKTPDLSLIELIPFIPANSGDRHEWTVETGLREAKFRGEGEFIVAETASERAERSESKVSSISNMVYDEELDSFQLETWDNPELEVAKITTNRSNKMLDAYQRYFLSGDIDRNYKGFNGLIKLCPDGQIVQGSQDIYKDMIRMRAKVNKGEEAVYIMNESTLVLLEAQDKESITKTRTDFGVPLTSLGPNNILAMPDSYLPIGTVLLVLFDKDEGVAGLTKSGLSVRNLGEMHDTSSIKIRFEWFCGVALMNPKGISVRKEVI